MVVNARLQEIQKQKGDRRAQMEAINVANTEEVLRIQREESQRMQKMQTESNFMGVHALNQQTEVLKAGATSLGMMGAMNNTPPPLPQSQYFVAVNGVQNGPFSTAQLSQFASSGELNRDTLVWKQGMESWQSAGSIDELAAIFASPQMPPPIPSNE